MLQWRSQERKIIEFEIKKQKNIQLWPEDFNFILHKMIANTAFIETTWFKTRLTVDTVLAASSS